MIKNTYFNCNIPCLLSITSKSAPLEKAVNKDPIDLIRKYKETFLDPDSGSFSFCF